MCIKRLFALWRSVCCLYADKNSAIDEVTHDA